MGLNYAYGQFSLKPLNGGSAEELSAANNSPANLGPNNSPTDPGPNNSPTDPGSSNNGTTTNSASQSNGNGDGNGSGFGASGQEGETFTEHTVLGIVGVGGESFGVSVNGGFAVNSGGVHGNAYLVGTTLRYSPPGHRVLLGGTYVDISRDTGIQVNLTYDVRLGGALWVTPSLVGQKVDRRDISGAARLALSWRGPKWTPFVSGRYGRTYHEVDWSASTVASYEDDLIAGAAAGFTYRPAASWAVGLTGAWEHYESKQYSVESDGIIGLVTLSFNTVATK